MVRGGISRVFQFFADIGKRCTWNVPVLAPSWLLFNCDALAKTPAAHAEHAHRFVFFSGTVLGAGPTLSSNPCSQQRLRYLCRYLPPPAPRWLSDDRFLKRCSSLFHTTRRTSHSASRSEQAMPAWLVKTRRSPSRHGRDARVYGHTTTAMHKLSTPPPPPPLTQMIVVSLSSFSRGRPKGRGADFFFCSRLLVSAYYSPPKN